MKKILSLLVLTLCQFFAFSQTPTPSENNILKLTYISWQAGVHTFELKNKSECKVYVRLEVNGKNSDISINGNSTYTIKETAPINTIVTVRAKRTSGGTCVRGVSSSWIELQSPLPLPIKFLSISAKRQDSGDILLTFETEEDNSIHQYNVNISEDGRNFKTYSIVMPNGIVGKKKYTVIIKKSL